MVKNIEHFHAELNVEVLRDFTDVVIFENGEVQAGDSGTDQNIAAGITAQGVALQRGGIDCAAETGRRGAAIGIPKRSDGSGWYAKALRLDVIAGVAGIGGGCASGSAQAVGVGKIVAAQ